MILPHLFEIHTPDGAYWIVEIAASDLRCYESKWMDDLDLPNWDKFPNNEIQNYGTFVPDVDLVYQKKKFMKYEEAVAFIREWWLTSDHAIIQATTLVGKKGE
jgi:hypothetical protein